MAGHFDSSLDLEEQPDGQHFKLLTPLVYTTSQGPRLAVPAGFVTDFASVPRVLWNILPPFGKHSKAAVVHDWLYRYAPGNISRSQADGVFNDAMQACGVGRFTRLTMYAGVRVGGAAIWAKYREPAEPQAA